MGSVYKKKRRSCAMCKPHKMKWAPKRTLRQADLKRQHEEQMCDGERN